jgi:tetratricopeptide (TPR) repeat protein
MKIQKALLIVLILLLLLLVGKAISMLGANLNFYQASKLQEHWLKTGKLANKQQYTNALEAIESANSKHPNNPEYIVTQGLILEWAGISDLFTEQEQQQNLLLAKQYYLKATELRPTWSVTWANLAILKWRLNEIDQALIDYLMQAEKFGKNTVDVQKSWVEVGLFLYQNKSKYTPQIMTGLRSHLQFMLQDHRVKIRRSAINIVKRHGAERLVCKWIRTYDFDTTSQQKALCNKASAPF